MYWFSDTLSTAVELGGIELSYWTKQVIDGTFERMFIIIARLHTNNYKHRNIHNNENFIGASGLLTLLFPIIAASSSYLGTMGRDNHITILSYSYSCMPTVKNVLIFGVKLPIIRTFIPNNWCII